MFGSDAKRGETMAGVMGWYFAWQVVKLFLVDGMILAAALVWYRIWSQIDRPRLELAAGFLASCGIVLFIYPGYFLKSISWIKSWEAVSFLLIFATVLSVWAVGYLKLSVSDYLLLGTVLFVMQKYSYHVLYCRSMLLITGWILLLAIVQRRYRSARQQAMPCLLTLFSATICYCIYQTIFEGKALQIYYNIARQYDFDRIQKFFCLLFITFCFLLIFALLMFLLKRGLHYYFSKAQEMSEKYEEIGAYLLAVPVMLFVVLFLLDIAGMFYDTELVPFRMGTAAIFIAAFLGMQLFYLKLLLKTVQLKEHLEYQEKVQEHLQLYHRKMNENMQEIRAIKHDMKNIFLTMGELVRRNGDAPLQEYYYSQIAPFAQAEIQKNDMYVQLQMLQNETLEAFLHYKLLQGISAGEDIRIVTMLDHTYFPHCVDVSDIVRITGIFLDNALEEVQQMQDGHVELELREQEGTMQILIKNTVRTSTLERGVHAGVTSKGLGRGNGLVIAKRLIDKHSDILWNSYFQGNLFVQSIQVFRPER